MTKLQIYIFNFIHCYRRIRNCLEFDIQYYFQYFNTNTYTVCLYGFRSLLVLSTVAWRFVFFSFIAIHYSEDLMKCREAKIMKIIIMV